MATGEAKVTLVTGRVIQRRQELRSKQSGHRSWKARAQVPRHEFRFSRVPSDLHKNLATIQVPYRQPTIRVKTSEYRSGSRVPSYKCPISSLRPSHPARLRSGSSTGISCARTPNPGTGIKPIKNQYPTRQAAIA